MKSIWNESDRRDLLARLDRISEATPPKWGTMTADRMLAHLSQSMKMANGELPTKSKRLPIRYFPLKQLIIYALPFPKGAPTAPELLAGPEAPVATLKPEVGKQIEQFAAPADADRWPEHPAFGKLTKAAWGALIYKHVNHHLTQFGL